MTDDSRKLVARLYEALYAGDADGVGSLFADDGEYTDAGTPPDEKAVGPAAVAARIKPALHRVKLTDRDRNTVAEGNLVVTEHVENWQWETGEQVDLPIVSVHEVHDGKVTRWTDYWDLQTLMNGAPSWWVEHVVASYAE